MPLGLVSVRPTAIVVMAVMPATASQRGTRRRSTGSQDWIDPATSGAAMTAPIAIVRTDRSTQPDASTRRRISGHGRRGPRAHVTTTSASASATTDGTPNPLKSGACHSATKSAIAFVASGARSSFGPTGVSAATARLANTTRLSLEALERFSRPSIASPRTTSVPIATPTNHMPCVQAHSHDAGTSHQRDLRSSLVLSHAVMTTAVMTNDAICGLGLRLRLVPTSARMVAMEPAAIAARWRQLT